VRTKPLLATALALAVITGIAWTDDDKELGGAPGADTSLPRSIQDIMDQPRYDDATWSLLVVDVNTGETFYSLNPDELSLTGSTRKLFSVGTALDTLGADHRVITPVYRTGPIDDAGRLAGNLVLVGAGDLTFGGRRIDANTVEYTNFDHNDANNLGTAILTPQDPLFALDALARQVRASGITAVEGDVAIDDRLFVPYRVPNGNLLITPVMLNENMVDVTVTPTSVGTPAALAYRPATNAFAVDSAVTTTAAGTEPSVELSTN
jgi:D-alanyl-D-alanine carboxypeptidase